MSKLILLNKPYDVVSQFTDKDGAKTLAQFVNTKRVYPAGRLDKDSEGLLLLTNDGALQARIAEPKQKLAKSYWVQVEKTVSPSIVKQLSSGIQLSDGMTLPAKVKHILEPADLWSRNPPVRRRDTVPTDWLEITITEGRNRQIRRMTAAVGHPTLRLIRHRIGDWQLGDLQPGESIVLNKQSFL
ncbi:MAG: pseudouridine synthase [Gammaproteobacteria bacterium]|jgi:23S rRNA pseudouridine2457 synthase|nr:pseudouridine synthase [Gammaproteobacteria bacterium]